MPTPLHAMFVHAHPDDESSKGAAGDILNPAMDRPGVRERMREIRAAELARALEILGITDHFELGYPDSGYVEGFDGDGSKLAAHCFSNTPVAGPAERLARIIRAERPDVVVTYPENGGYPIQTTSAATTSPSSP